MKSIIVGALLLVASFPVAADSAKVTGIFSNMHFAVEDVIGVEVFIVFSHMRGQGQYVAAVQCSEGAPGIAEVVPVTVSGSDISFKITSEQSGCPTTSFTGRVSKQGLLGSFEGTTNYPGFLKRGPSYWQ